MPFSCAIFFANGEAKMRPSLTTCAGAAVAGATGAVATGAAVGAAAGVEAGEALLAPPAFIPLTIASMSIPCGPIMHNKSFTKILSPFCAPWYNKIPSL